MKGKSKKEGKNKTEKGWLEKNMESREFRTALVVEHLKELDLERLRPFQRRLTLSTALQSVADVLLSELQGICSDPEQLVAEVFEGVRVDLMRRKEAKKARKANNHG